MQYSNQPPSIAARWRRRRGFVGLKTLVFSALVSASVFLGLPTVLKETEQRRADEAFEFLESVSKAQLVYRAKNGAFGSRLEELNLDRVLPVYFTVGDFSAGATGSGRSSWSLTLTRESIYPGHHGNYSVTFTDQGFHKFGSSISAHLCSSRVNN